MPILPPDSGPWRTPSDGPTLVTVHVTRRGDREVTIRPGADASDVAAAMAAVPADAVFTDHHGDVDAVLVFRPIPGVPAVVPNHNPVGPLVSAAR